MLSFRSLAESLEDPGEFLLTDFAKLERSPLLHIGFQALDAFTVRSRSPAPPSLPPACVQHTALSGICGPPWRAKKGLSVTGGGRATACAWQ